MNIEQIAVGIKDAHGLDMSDEAAITLLRHALSKLAEQDVEPVAHLRFWAAQHYAGHGNIEFDEGFEVTTRMEPGVDCSPAFPVFTEAQLLAAQQRTAEACAKAVFEQAKYFGYNVHAEAVRDAALNNWREYL